MGYSPENGETIWASDRPELMQGEDAMVTCLDHWRQYLVGPGLWKRVKEVQLTGGASSSPYEAGCGPRRGML